MNETQTQTTDIENPKETENKIETQLEEAWSESHEKLAKKWMNESKIISESHNKSGKNNKFKYSMVKLPAILIPIIFSPITVSLSHVEGFQFVNMAIFLLSGSLNAIDGFYNYQKKYQKHMDYSARYSDLNSDIQYELVKSRKFRSSPDEFLMKTQMKYDALASSAPDL
jgi:hypothetical protein